ncbi:hypothetical protein HYH02_010802 [Chlamydomonas schloesseri]|uniref:CCHC-type domain-containing protein n=1 Tax=Chlamydomonas schloesseri TaxID=2026947 RepID=A0A835T6I5_9CHLO|nr:hypothetical protein HYH02_010802 [Chlamydomonas schloesseri]|eukprot:KAG2438346.1 hypothetical protein HYH02_010802 [Chlamydomonas schloesseri]
MASSIRFKFRAELSYSNLPFDGHYITVGELKRLIAEKKGLGVDAANELQLTDATSKRDYDNDAEQVMKNSAVIVRRVAGAAKPKTILSSSTVPAPAAPAAPAAVPMTAAPLAAADLAPAHVDDEFGEDPYAKAAAVKQDEQQMMAFLAHAAQGVNLEAQLAAQTAPAGRGRGRGRGGFGAGGGRGGRGAGRECLRCGQLGHFISECPTQGDPVYDKRFKVPSGIPASKIQRNADGSLYLPDGELGELAANTSAFNKLAAMMGRGPAAPESGAGGAQGSAAAAVGAGEPSAPAAWQDPTHAAAALKQQQLQNAGGADGGVAAAQEQTQMQQMQQQLLLMQQRMQQLQQQQQQQTPEREVKQEPAQTAEPKLFDDDDHHGAGGTQPGAMQQPVKLGLGMVADDGGRQRSASPAPSRLTGSLAAGAQREDGTAAGAAAGGGGGAGRDVDHDGIPSWVADTGCSRHELSAVLPFLRNLLPGDMSMQAVFRAFASGRPLLRREFLELQSAERHAADRQRRDKDRDRERDRGRSHRSRSRSRDRRSKRSRSRSPSSRSRSRSRSPSKRHRARSSQDVRERERDREKERERAREKERERERHRERDRERAGRYHDRDVKREEGSPSLQQAGGGANARAAKRSRSPPGRGAGERAPSVDARTRIEAQRKVRRPVAAYQS